MVVARVLRRHVAFAALFGASLRSGNVTEVGELENVPLAAVALLFSLGCGDQSGAPADERDASQADVGQGRQPESGDEEDEDRETTTDSDAMSRLDVSAADVSAGADPTASEPP